MIYVLDCTLRDGGYVNNWRFKRRNISSILSNLEESKIDFIECGYLKDNLTVDLDKTLYNYIEQIESILPTINGDSKYVVMINFGEYKLENIPIYKGGAVFGIRVVFSQLDWRNALVYCQQLIDKGYAVFIQPMMTINYTDEELIEFMKTVNKILPYACYIVDSFGVMKKSELMRMAYFFDHNLNQNILLGYHGHNNLQLAYSNAQMFAELPINRDKIIDSSVYGMGRGAGNLNTELFIQYLNENFETKYKLVPLLNVIDETISQIYQQNYWGYSMSYYLSAIYYCHPNYATYLSEKNTLTVDDMKNIISSIDKDKKNIFDKKYIEMLYQQYQSHDFNDIKSLLELREICKERNILLIGPGRSVADNLSTIVKFCKDEKSLLFAVNHKLEFVEEDFIFISNIKRFKLLQKGLEDKIIVTSNIRGNALHKVNYHELLIDNSVVSDNAMLMAIKLFIKLGVKEISLAGFDGFVQDQYQNYLDEDLIFTAKTDKLKELNNEIKNELVKMEREIQLNFLTASLYRENDV